MFYAPGLLLAATYFYPIATSIHLQNFKGYLCACSAEILNRPFENELNILAPLLRFVLHFGPYPAHKDML
jgi:hypothetical protein